MHALILTLFPEMFPGTLGHSLAGKALEKGVWSYEVWNIRDFTMDKHKTVDDKTYGGGTGLVMKPDVVGAAIDAALAKLPNARLVYLTPRGVPFTQGMAYELTCTIPPACGGDKGGETIATNFPPYAPPVNGGGKGMDLIILCGRYEGVDQRILDEYQPLEISLGDYVLSGGEIAAQVLLDACIRLLPGVISKEEALEFESFSISTTPLPNPPPQGERGFIQSESADEPVLSNAPCESQQTFTGAINISAGLLEYPQYTAPPLWKGHAVPEILRSGNHQAVAQWRLEQAEKITQARRADLWERYSKSKKE